MYCLIFRFIPILSVLLMIKSFRFTSITTRKILRNICRAQIDCGLDFEEVNPSSDFKRDKPKVLFVLGGPGAGKGTQCEKLSAEYGMIHLSAGELLREERLSGSSDGVLIESYLKEGKIVPVQITLDLLRKAMEAKNCNRYLVDGFPRNWDNIEGWETCMPGVCTVEAVLFIDCPEEELQRRLLSRGQTSGRSDDNIETARKRFTTFRETTMPIIDHFEKQNKLIRLRGDLDKETVFESFKVAVHPFIARELINLNQRLLDAISSGDWQTYASLCDPSLTCFEEESEGHLIEGLQFHKFYFENPSLGGSPPGDSEMTPPGRGPLYRSSIEGTPSVRLMGRSAVVSYRRLISSVESSSGSGSSGGGGSSSSSESAGTDRRYCDETRVWQLIEGRWRLVHLHRGPVSRY